MTLGNPVRFIQNSKELSLSRGGKRTANFFKKKIKEGKDPKKSWQESPGEKPTPPTKENNGYISLAKFPNTPKGTHHLCCLFIND